MSPASVPATRSRRRTAPVWLLAGAAWVGGPAAAGPQAIDAAARESVARFAHEAATRAAERHGRPVRLSVSVGQSDARLRLAPCRRTEAHALPGAAPWGATRVGLRCIDGEVRWSIAVPVTVTAHATTWVATAALPAGTRLGPQDLREAEVDLAADRSPAITAADQLLGRELLRAVEAGAALRQSHLKARRWFDAGDTVRLVARGEGFRVDGSGQALNPGVEGRPTQVRTEGGRIVTVRPVGDREAEVVL